MCLSQFYKILQNLVDASQEHAKPQLPLILQNTEGATATVAPYSTAVQQYQLYNTQQQLLKLLPL